MSGLTPEFTSNQQFQVPQLAFEPQQMQQQMAAMMSMAAAGMANNNSSSSNGVVVSGMFDSGTGVPSMPPPPPAAAPAVPDAASFFSATQQPGTSSLPGVDPSMAQAYAASMLQYLQQAQAVQQAYAGLGTDAMMLPAASPFVAAPPLPSYTAGVAAPSVIPTINVSVEGMRFQYQLTEDDLQKVFSRYGSVRDISVDSVGTTAQITFGDAFHAQSAMNDLNGKVLLGLEGTLRISWAQPATGQQLASTAFSVMPPFPGGWGFPGSPSWPTAPTSGLGVSNLGEVSSYPQSPLPSNVPTSPGTPPPHSASLSNITPDGKAPAHVKGVRKYTCRFLVGIDNDKDFQVVRRIIGAKGSNMKRIVKQSQAKLRLRGVGSGYFEGAGQKESNEPLQLCVSCTSAEGYRTAVSLVQELMEDVYREYRTFCQETGRPEPELQATPQLVSSGRDRGGAGLTVDQLFSPDGGIDMLPLGDDDDDDDSPSKRDGARKRGRRSRGKKGADGKVEKGEPPRNAPDVEEIQVFIDQRNEARRQCNFSEADRIRQSLHERGVALMDEPGGRGKACEVTTWRYWRE